MAGKDLNIDGCFMFCMVANGKCVESFAKVQNGAEQREPTFEELDRAVQDITQMMMYMDLK